MSDGSCCHYCRKYVCICGAIEQKYGNIIHENNKLKIAEYRMRIALWDCYNRYGYEEARCVLNSLGWNIDEFNALTGHGQRLLDSYENVERLMRQIERESEDE